MGGSSAQGEAETKTGRQCELGPGAGSDQPASLERKVQRWIAYYSDFEVDLNDWKSEDERIQIYSDTLKKALGSCHLPQTFAGEPWLAGLKSVLYDLVDEGSAVRPSKSNWEVALEYVLLTRGSTKASPLADRCRKRRKEWMSSHSCTPFMAIK